MCEHDKCCTIVRFTLGLIDGADLSQLFLKSSSAGR